MDLSGVMAESTWGHREAGGGRKRVAGMTVGAWLGDLVWDTAGTGPGWLHGLRSVQNITNSGVRHLGFTAWAPHFIVLLVRWHHMAEVQCPKL